MRKIENTVYVVVVICFFVMVIIGALNFANGFEINDPMMTIAGLSLMFVGLSMLMEFRYANDKSNRDKEVEQLKTDIALLQNRMDYLEDDNCKEYKREQFSHNIEDDFP